MIDEAPQPRVVKRLIDLGVALPVVVVTAPICLVLFLIAGRDTRASGLFRQERVGHEGRFFTVYKIRTMRQHLDANTITTVDDPRITRLGSLLRRWKVDELPQFWNVLTGDMSLVGPRPDVSGYADLLSGDDRKMLRIRPGITGPATLLFRDEETYLGDQPDLHKANDSVVWPAKVRINCLYAEHGTLRDDLALLSMTLKGIDERLREMILRWDSQVCVDHPVVDQLLLPKGET